MFDLKSYRNIVKLVSKLEKKFVIFIVNSRRVIEVKISCFIKNWYKAKSLAVSLLK